MEAKINSESEIKLRRYKSNLAVCGKGYILFGFWSVIKFFLTSFGNREQINRIYSESDLQGADPVIVIIIFIAIMLIMILLIMSVHFWIGLGALSLSRGKKKSVLFMVMVGLFMVLNLISIPMYFADTPQSAENVSDTSIAALFVDMTVSFILFDILFCAAKIRSLQKQAK